MIIYVLIQSSSSTLLILTCFPFKMSSNSYNGQCSYNSSTSPPTFIRPRMRLYIPKSPIIVWTIINTGRPTENPPTPPTSSSGSSDEEDGSVSPLTSRSSLQSSSSLSSSSSSSSPEHPITHKKKICIKTSK